ncbi:hypothetical protein C0993_004800 [Termitomyces sp. T159_Od127]|nr:hypothetical protein C0993_004800 [Termitomyces sp. T159_Od127]
MPISPCSFTSGIRLEAPSSPIRLDWHQEEVVSLFRELSRLVSQATEDARAQARDDKKLKAYTELSSILSKTSSNVPTAVTPTLADILLRHAQGKQRIEEHYAAISGIWNKVFDIFTSDISRTVDSMLAGAVKKITEAADLASKSIFSEGAWTENQQTRQPSDASGKFCEDRFRNRFSKHRVVKEGEMDSRRDPKRRRISPSPDVMYTPAKSVVKMEQSMHEILSQMKSKIDEQAQSLQKLLKENNEIHKSQLLSLFGSSKHHFSDNLVLCCVFDTLHVEFDKRSSSNLTPIILTTVSPPSPSPTSNTEDAYNTAEARIHFGPLGSPEKPIAAIVARRDSLQPVIHSPSPLRRSPRLSTPLPPLPVREYGQEELQEETTGMNVVEEDGEAVDEGISRVGTPDVERDLQDEPPSALAMKISRAYDNPSPPPSPSNDFGLAGLATSSPRPSPLIASLCDAANDGNLEDATPSTPSPVATGSSRNLSPIPPTIPSASLKSSPPDLISFESFSSPAPVFRAMSPSISAPRPSHPSAMPDAENQSLGPFNFPSSPKAGETQAVSKPMPASVEDKVGEAMDAEKITENRQEEQSVLRTLLSPEEGSHVNAQLMSASHLDESTRTLTKQSSRPRRSVSQYRYQHFDQLITRLSQTPKMSTGKTRPQSIPNLPDQDERTTVEAKNRETEEDQHMNSPPKSTFFRELGSLSPTSNDLLSSLVTSSQHSSSFPLTLQPNKEASSLPQRVLFQSSPVPALPQTPRRSSGPIRLSSPSRSAARESNKTQLPAVSLDNSFCTPARRIPIEDAIAQGYISPLKGSQLLANNSRVGLDSLHKPLLTIRPNDSPARRVPVLPEVATPVVPKKWEGMRFGSPTRSSTKERSRSVEPVTSGASKGKVRERGGSVPPPVGTSSSLSKSEDISSKTYRTDRKVKPPGRADNPQVSPLKRKRTAVEMSSPVKSRSTVTLRQVPRVLVPNATSNPGATSVTVLKKPQQLRRVIDKPPDVAVKPSAHSISQAVTPISSSALAPTTQIGAIASDEVKSDYSGISVPEESSGEKISAPVETIGIDEPPEPVIPNGVRRTTRVRKVLNPSLISDAFGPAEVKPRRKPASQTGDITYSGMSATALRALTTSNTVKNQRYLAAKLETEIIRKEGDRPESPIIKIKTVLQREQEEKKRKRKERAIRRARSGGNIGHLNDKDRHSDRDTENESDWDDQSSSPSPKKHQRGPGDEEEYKTPVRKLKRLKLVDDDDKEESVENERRVKWDRGLFTTISLDQVKLGTRRPPMEDIVVKGCLAPAAKTLPLDNLGNLPYADTPLTELIEENIVVKKFVYDNDVEAVEEVIVKNTRARNKKGKS